jgi:H+/Cl- antiporter ClcA
VAQQTNATPDSLRNAVRWGLLLAAIGTIGFRLPRLVSEFRQWRGAVRLTDASVAQGWRTILLVDCVSALIVLAIGIAVFYAVRPRTKSAP